jgi:hypothetical protein
VGLLYTIAHFRKLGLRTAPPLISKTSKPQAWHVPSRHDGLRTKPIQEVTVQKLKRKASTREGVTPTTYCPVKQPVPWYSFASKLTECLEEHDKNAQWLKILKTNDENPLVQSKYGLVPHGSILSYQLKQNEDTVVTYPSMCNSSIISNCLEQYSYVLNRSEHSLHTSCFYDLATCSEIETKTRQQSMSALWKSVRLRRITASNFHRVVVRQANEDKLVEDLLRGSRVMTQAMKYGLEQEQSAAELYEQITGNKTLPIGFVININAPHLGASPDRIVVEQQQLGLLEIKCPQNEHFHDCKFLVRHGSLYKLKTNHA